MNRVRLWLAGVAFALVAVLAGCDNQKHPAGEYQGYLEGRFLGVASPQEGQLLELKVRRGDWVEAGAPLFALDPEPESDELRMAQQQVQSAQAKVTDLRKGLRDPEIAQLEAQLHADRAELELANVELKRSQPLSQDKLVSAQELDRLRLTAEERDAMTARDQSAIDTGKLGSRTDQINQAAADLANAEAACDRAQWLLDQKVQTAPQAGFVQDTLYRVGERVEPGQPVVVLLPPSELRARFYVPEPEINLIQPGKAVTVTLDGRDPFPARVSYISDQVEFTPPVIYSRDQNYKYVFLVEADIDPALARTLRPGQPATVRLSP
jgi:HlyD family secretion protein